MSATARDLADANVPATIHHEHASDFEPEGNDPMSRTPERSAQRYIYTCGARPLDGFTIKRAIGRGGFGEVYYATSDAGKEVALKLITRNLEVERRGVVQCMNLKSPHLVAIHDLKQNDDGDTFVIMEYVAGPSLAQVLMQHPAGLPPAEVRMWLKGLVEGVAYLHDHGIVHRDLKPANLFLEEGVVKIGDYGLSKAITSQSREPGHSECVGTCHYMAPETSTGKYHKPIDVYAIGVILHEMVCGRVPFDGESVGEVLMKHLTSRPNLDGLPEPFKGIVARAMAKDPNHRPAKVTDLLLPGDAPREPAVRFIGDRSSPPTPPSPNAVAPPAKEEVLRIDAEDPVFYIGPETRPSRPPASRPLAFNPWPWGRRPTRLAPPVRRASPPRRADPPRPDPRVQAASRPAPPPEPEPLGPPPPLPSARVRVAELSTSMLAAAPVAAIGSILLLPLVQTMADGPKTDPRQMAVVFGLALLTAWSNLAAGKLWEAGPDGLGPLAGFRKQLFMLLPGALVGLAGFGLWQATHAGPIIGNSLVAEALNLRPSPLGLAATFAAYMAVMFGSTSWWAVAARNRAGRLQLGPLVLSGVLGVPVFGLLCLPILPIAPLAFSLGLFTTQMVSPWSRTARDYKRQLQAANRRAARNVA